MNNILKRLAKSAQEPVTYYKGFDDVTFYIYNNDPSNIFLISALNAANQVIGTINFEILYGETPNAATVARWNYDVSNSGTGIFAPGSEQLTIDIDNCVFNWQYRFNSLTSTTAGSEFIYNPDGIFGVNVQVGDFVYSNAIQSETTIVNIIDANNAEISTTATTTALDYATYAQATTSFCRIAYKQTGLYGTNATNTASSVIVTGLLPNGSAEPWSTVGITETKTVSTSFATVFYPRNPVFPQWFSIGYYPRMIDGRSFIAVNKNKYTGTNPTDQASTFGSYNGAFTAFDHPYKKSIFDYKLDPSEAVTYPFIIVDTGNGYPVESVFGTIQELFAIEIDSDK